MKNPVYNFLKRAGKFLNSGQSRSIFITGNIHDLFYIENDGVEEYVPLINFLTTKWKIPGKLILVYELNGPIRFVEESAKEKLKASWIKWRTGLNEDDLIEKEFKNNLKKDFDSEILNSSFENNLEKAIGRPTVALELLRQFCLCSRSFLNDEPVLWDDLIIIVEGADLMLPPGNITSLSEADRHRIIICRDWFSDPGFMEGDDSVILLSESASLINERVARLPQILESEIPSPDIEMRKHFISYFNQSLEDDNKLKLFSSQKDLALFTAGLTIQALNQLLKGASYSSEKLTVDAVIDKVEEFIKLQVGDDVVEFKKPSHKLKDVIGFKYLKKFLNNELIPRFSTSDKDALPGAAVCGPIGAGKTFIFEAMASELDMVVLVLKNIRSQWFGQTDVIFERLKRVLEALNKVMIFVDEADTQFGNVGKDGHATERRLTGKIQAMMSDTRLRGKVIWLLMTARINLLSPDIRRPGRVGDLIIPILDPTGDDRIDFVKWMVNKSLGKINEKEAKELLFATTGFSAAGFASLRSEISAKHSIKKLEFRDVLEILEDRIPPAIEETRRYQELQALINCTRKSLLPPVIDVREKRKIWRKELDDLERSGIS